MSWTFTLTLDGYDFVYTDGDNGNVGGITVPWDADVEDPDYAVTLNYALSLYPHVADYMLIKEAYYNWYRYWDRERVDRESVLLAIERFTEQDELSYPDWIDAFRRDVRQNTPQLSAPQRPAKVKDLSGYVYLVKSVSGHYKIGRAKDPNNRAKTFGVQLPFEIEFVAVIKTDDYVALEEQLHAKYQDKRVNGEWFALTPEDVEYIKGLAK
jgi:hypothetical protein